MRPGETRCSREVDDFPSASPGRFAFSLYIAPVRVVVNYRLWFLLGDTGIFRPHLAQTGALFSLHFLPFQIM